MLADLIQDIRYASRLLRASPGFVLVAVLAIGLGVGANAAIFSLVNGAMLRPLPVSDPDRLAWVVQRRAGEPRSQWLSYPDYVDYRDGSGAFENLAAYADLAFSIAGSDQPERVRGQMVSGNFFTTMGIPPAAGRLLAEPDDRRGAAPAVVLSHALWKRRFGKAPTVVGSTLILNGQIVQIVGVAPEGFLGAELGTTPDVWVCLAMHDLLRASDAGLAERRNAGWLRVIGRLAAGTTLDTARAALSVVSSRLESEYPATHRQTFAEARPMKGRLHPSNESEAIPLFVLLLVVTGIVLLIACGNVANLLLSRAAGRRREIGIRLALGATRGRLIRQLLAESLLLSLLGGGCGLLMAAWTTDLLMAVSEAPAELRELAQIDGRVILFGLAAAIASGLVFGLAPAFRSSRPDVVGSLKEGVGAAGGGERRRMQRALVSGQVALSLVLLVAAGLFLRSFGKAAAVDPGFDPRGAIALSFDLGLQGHSSEEAISLQRELLSRVETLPGVDSATLAGVLPMSGTMFGSALLREEDAATGDTSGIYINTIWPRYFKTMGIPLTLGRDFTMSDGAGSLPAVIVNETAARRLWPEQDPLGRRLSLDGAGGPWLTVIGIARDGKYDELTEDPRPFAYLAYLQNPGVISEQTLVVRAAGDPAPLAPRLREEIRRLDANLPIFKMATLEESLRLRMDKQRVMTRMLTLFGSLALLLAATGLYGVMAYNVARRTREIGIRIALGAGQTTVVKMIVREGIRLALVGVAVGLLLSLALTRLLSGMLFGVTPTDLATLIFVSAMMTGVAAAASWLPARRAARTDPMAALRCE
ncbi:MAG TPA: ABC transporter permease [Candidatus Polarisedimenticolia bacterium]|nr:ABC transporter permease [Candidatus Polarisedimenticolia bacterium]